MFTIAMILALAVWILPAAFVAAVYVGTLLSRRFRGWVSSHIV